MGKPQMLVLLVVVSNYKLDATDITTMDLHVPICMFSCLDTIRFFLSNNTPIETVNDSNTHTHTHTRREGNMQACY